MATEAMNSCIARSPALCDPSDCISCLMICILRLPQRPLFLGVCIHPPTLPSGTLDAVEATIPPNPALLHSAHRLRTFASAQRHAFLPPDSREGHAICHDTTHSVVRCTVPSLPSLHRGQRPMMAPWSHPLIPTQCTKCSGELSQHFFMYSKPPCFPLCSNLTPSMCRTRSVACV